jgi:hypothetical protein
MPTRILSNQSFLAVYSGLLTIAFIVTVLTAAKRDPGTALDEITVHRINVVEPDGTMRMVITNKANAPGFYIKNKEFRHPNRQSAGFLFFDDEGTEDGGLIYGLERDANGKLTGNNVHLSFDQYMQDQIFTIDAGRDNGHDYSLLTMQDRGNYPLLDKVVAADQIAKLPSSQQQQAWANFKATHSGDEKRVTLGRAEDGSTQLRLKDKNGRDRIVLLVAPDGNPTIELLDANGRVLDTLPRAIANK